MLSVHPPIQMETYDIDRQQTLMSQKPKPKQIEKKPLITFTKVIVAVTIICILAIASYKAYTIAFPAPSENKMAQSHSKIISNAGSSSGRGSSSQTGSQSSSGTKTSNRPIGVAQPAGKDKVSSNFGTGSDDDGEQPSDKNNDGSKRDSILKNNKRDGSSTEGDSESEDSDSGQIEGQYSLQQNRNQIPLIGGPKRK